MQLTFYSFLDKRIYTWSTDIIFCLNKSYQWWFPCFHHLVFFLPIKYSCGNVGVYRPWRRKYAATYISVYVLMLMFLGTINFFLLVETGIWILFMVTYFFWLIWAEHEYFAKFLPCNTPAFVYLWCSGGLRCMPTANHDSSMILSARLQSSWILAPHGKPRKVPRGIHQNDCGKPKKWTTFIVFRGMEVARSRVFRNVYLRNLELLLQLILHVNKIS